MVATQENLPKGVRVRDFLARPNDRGIFFEALRQDWDVSCTPVRWNASQSHARRCPLSNRLRRVIDIGTKATAQLGGGCDNNIQIAPGVLGEKTGDAYFIDTDDAMPLREELCTFVNFICGGPPPCATDEDGLLVVERIAQ